jgi:hypothetical protein
MKLQKLMTIEILDLNIHNLSLTHLSFGTYVFYFKIKPSNNNVNTNKT